MHLMDAGEASLLRKSRSATTSSTPFKWLRDEELDDPAEVLEPEELITTAMEELQLALDDLADMQRLLEGNGGAA
jgi:K+/H+ antiporter YhaU regulatory subunit KhtT